ncbi:hypothetical protein DERP_015276 [Dermatophagoides pteronyssinus]|uniref:Uncharacterized protein n=1 Tax=Dermatophagoides pteronyssinus TaxID=6956 RepID=A0ABQ8J3J7_DERPT|nr:hypothetical protein DERP_015276 [Dermatophagoides pteronyssinus]
MVAEYPQQQRENGKNQFHISNVAIAANAQLDAQFPCIRIGGNVPNERKSISSEIFMFESN